MTQRMIRALGATAMGGALMALAACGDNGAAPTTDLAANDTPAPAPSAAASAPQTACDRACLLDVTDRYLAAMVARDPSRAPLADDFALVENVRRSSVNDGLWTTLLSTSDAFKIRVPDAVNQSAGFMGVVERQTDNGPEKALMSVRLQLEDGRIAEAEHLVVAATNPNFAVNLETVRPGFAAVIPEANRLSHDALIQLGYSYYDALDDNNSELTVFAEDCQRHENGIITAGPDRAPRAEATPGSARALPIATDCHGQINSGAFQYIDRIEHRRVFAADPVTGLVMGQSHFRHPMDPKQFEITTVTGETAIREMDNNPFDMPATHIFKIGPDGRMHEIEAVGVSSPYNSPTGWE